MGHLLSLSTGHQQEAESEMYLIRHELVLIEDTGIAESSFTHYTIMLDPQIFLRFIFLKCRFYREKIDVEGLLSAGLLPKWLQWPELNQCFSQEFHVTADVTTGNKGLNFYFHLNSFDLIKRFCGWNVFGYISNFYINVLFILIICISAILYSNFEHVFSVW